MIGHSGIGTNLRNMIPGLIQYYKLSLLGSSELLNLFPWSKETVIIEATCSIYSIKEQLELPMIIPSCDLFISPHYNIPIRKIKARKRAVIINDVNHLVFTDEFPFHKKLYARYMISAAIRKSDKVFTLSEFSKQEIIKYAGNYSKDIKVLYCGLDSEELKAKLNLKSFEKIRTKYNLPADYFLYVGSIKPHKNLLTALKAFNLWRSKYNGKNKLVLVGIKQSDLASNSEALNLIDKNSTIIPGYVPDDDLAVYYNNAKCLIFPSLYEGFGLPPLEAMIYGCPVLTSNSASLPEVCGTAALYFEPLNFEELASKMEQIINDDNLRRGLVEKGYTNASRFTREKLNENLKFDIDKMLLN
jgi:glycosyltransferase involved in cell wall biosynthesis